MDPQEIHTVFSNAIRVAYTSTIANMIGYALGFITGYTYGRFCLWLRRSSTKQKLRSFCTSSQRTAYAWLRWPALLLRIWRCRRAGKSIRRRRFRGWAASARRMRLPGVSRSFHRASDPIHPAPAHGRPPVDSRHGGGQ